MLYNLLLQLDVKSKIDFILQKGTESSQHARTCKSSGKCGS